MGRRRKHKKIPKEKDVVAMKYVTNTIDKQQLSSLCAESTTEEEQQLSSIQSNWLPFKWVSRNDDNDNSIDSNTNTSSHDVNGDSVSKADNTDISSNQPSHNSLLSELNDIKQQLMPAAKSCADAINDNSYSNHTTTPEYEFRQARSICNPYESLGLTYSKNESKKKKNRKRKYNNLQHSSSGFSQFINRSAIKLANIDALLGFILTLPPSLHNEEKQQQQRDEQPDNFVFVDLCGAPGGFSEYILYRHVHPATHIQDNDEKQHSDNSRIPCYGFGMSLLGTNDDGKGAQWKLEHLKQYHLNSNNTLNTKNSSGASHQKLHYQVCNGADGTGSIYNWDNVLQLQKEITTTLYTDRGDINNNKPLANLVVADGGFDSQRNSNNQESIAHKIVVSQTAAVLTLLAPRGTFALKMFGFKDEATRKMLHYLYGCFDQLTFVKPVLSRPASAERYLVCRGYTGQTSEWNGLKWRDQMIAGDAAGREAVDDKDTQLEELMNKFDKEILKLNINTCQSIINYLHEKRDAVMTNDDSPTYGNQEHSLNLKAYEEAWQLNSRTNT